MSRFQYYSIDNLIRFFLEQGKEGDCWDFKQEWHENIADLIKDIVCFANTVHDENCYLIFGVADNLDITGMQKPRRKQADIIDAISNLMFAGDVYPAVEVKTTVFDGTELDVLTIFNVKNTPIYLKKQYGQMRPGCIYTRIGDKNTPDNGNADMTDIEDLWRKRLGLTKPPLEYIYDRLRNKAEWTASDNGYYNVYRPEYTIEICPNDDDLDAEFYAYAMPNENTSYDELNIKYQTTILDSYQIVVLDGGRLQIPTPTWGFIGHYGYGLHHKYSYKYYICGSKRYKLLQFLYDPQNGDHRYAFMHLQEVVVFYYSDEERLDFEAYIERHQNLLSSTIAEISQFDYITTDTEQKTEIYKERLKVGKAINQILNEWRNTHSST
ncbi:ATP-binding protein [Gemmiger formicilis]|uniref:RNA-binding domain-containing protein n=1 Tax=Gemmiger formicilis TaxID=745368 RepID=UPI001959C375|nr:ATP-binding protein [Gemmiger formicilis]